jgi:hypothetical protein
MFSPHHAPYSSNSPLQHTLPRVGLRQVRLNRVAQAKNIFLKNNPKSNYERFIACVIPSPSRAISAPSSRFNRDVEIIATVLG